MSDSESVEDFSDITARCNYCQKLTKLAPGKNYCLKCKARCFRECRRCHKPYDSEKFFQRDQLRCNSCFSRLLKERERRQLKRMAEQSKAGDHEEDADEEPSTKMKKLHQPVAEDIIGNLPDGFSGAKMAFIPIFFR